jgi:tetratricopeptide (TPR) repeat protein
MFIQGGEVKMEFFTELLKHLDKNSRRQLLKEMADNFPSDKSFWLASGRAKLTDGDTEEALRDFDEATRISPDDPWVFAQKGSAMVDIGDFDHALAEIRTSIKLRPINPQAFFIRGNTQYMLDNLDEALESYEESFQQKPDFVAAINNLAHVYVLHHRYDEALRLLNKAISMDESYPFTYLNRAGCLRTMGRSNAQVIDALQQAERVALGNLVRGDDFERSTYCLFFVYAAIGNIVKAADYLQKCVDYRIPVKRWRTLERVWDHTIQNDPELLEIVEDSKF